MATHKRTLRDRLRDGSKGILRGRDTHKEIHQDALTHMMRQKQQLQIYERYLAFVEEAANEILPPPPGVTTLEIIRRRLIATRYDIQRTEESDPEGCCE